MAAKSFRELEADILERGYKAVIDDYVNESQNLTRVLGYLEEGFGEAPVLNPRVLTEEKDITGLVMKTALAVMRFSEKNL